MSYTEPVWIPPRRFAVIGGDGRMTHMAERLAEGGHEVAVLGCGAQGMPADSHGGRIRRAESLDDALEGAEVLVLPLPVTRDGETVACPREAGCVVTLAEIVDAIARRPGLRVFGGRLPEVLARRDGTASDPTGGAIPRVVDYYLDEGFQLRNAYITAEAAVMSAMQLIDCTLRGATVAVIGYGRIGRMLARLLHALGAEVTVAARREESLLWAALEGAHPLPLGATGRPGGGLYPLCFGHEVIFNTVPVQLIGREHLSRMEPGTVILDLASAPFGVDEAEARLAATEGIRYVRAPSLPGVYAPREAGYIVADYILGMLAVECRRQSAGGAGGKEQ